MIDDIVPCISILFFKYFLTWQNFKCLQQEAFREPPLPNLLKNEENQCLIIDVSTISFLSTISLYLGNAMIVFPLIIWVRWWFFFFFWLLSTIFFNVFHMLFYASEILILCLIAVQGVGIFAKIWGSIRDH